MRSRHEEVALATRNGQLQYAGSLIHDGKTGWQQLHEAQRESYLYQAMQLADDAYGVGGWRVRHAKETEPVQPYGLDGPIDGDDPVSLYVIIIERLETEL